MKAELYTYDFTVHPRDIGLDSTCWLNGEHLSHPFSKVLPAGAADLIDLALAIYAADRSSQRDFKQTNTGQRRIHVRVGLRNPDLWSAGVMANRLHEFLYWLSGDEWSFHLDEREVARPPRRVQSVSFRGSSGASGLRLAV